jgi:hypothetical protein
VRKLKLNSGQAFVTAKGKVVVAKTLQQPCGEKCKEKCTSLIPEEVRQKILEQYWKIADKHKQQMQVSKCMKEVVPKFRRALGGNRSPNYSYSFCIDNQNIRVCKEFFKATLSTSDTTILTASRKLNETGIVHPEMRGKHANRP